MSRPSRVFVLAEDERHQRFVYCYLQKLRFLRHEIRSKVAPAGRGSAEQWVREHYPEEVKECRNRSAQTALVVIIDSDTGEVHQRHRQFQQALEQTGMDRRANDEKIAHLIPKRNIETWILCLNGRMVDEESDYSRERDVDPQIAPAAIAFFEGNRTNLQPPDHWVDSLRLAIPEAVRLE